MAKQARPNVIIVTADQMRADCLGCFGNPDIATPHLDALAADGVKFTRAYVANPTCTPSRSSIVTGRYPHCHGVLCNGTSLPESERTVAQAFAEAGYRTAAVGKVHLRPHERGFSREWCVEFEGQPPYYGFGEIHLSDDYKLGEYLDFIEREHPEYLAAARDDDGTGRSRAGATGHWRPELPPDLHQSSWVVDRAIDFLGSTAGAPFFLWVGFTDPHHPFNPPEPYYSMYDESVRLPWPREADLGGFPPHWQGLQRSRRGWEAEQWDRLLRLYYGMITLIDDNVGRLCKRLGELGLADNTVVVFLPDHGELLGDHGLMLKGLCHMEALVRTPMIWRGPGVRRGEVNDRVSRTIDIAPTLLDLAGIDSEPCMNGVSLAPELCAAEPMPKRTALVEIRPWSGYDGWPKERPEDPPGPGPEVRTLVTQRWKLTYYAGLPYGELFDLTEDPHELRNLWSRPSHAKTRGQLIERLLSETVLTPEPALARQAPY